jgi:nucleoside-diphosphate-sugar epimerase
MSERCLVTGVSGFIGSHLAEGLLREGYAIVGIDDFSDSYEREIKESNLLSLREQPLSSFMEANLCSVDLAPYLRSVTTPYITQRRTACDTE